MGLFVVVLVVYFVVSLCVILFDCVCLVSVSTPPSVRKAELEYYGNRTDMGNNFLAVRLVF